MDSQPPPPRYSVRKRVLQDALDATTKSRNADYGPPDQDFRRTAEMVTAMWAHKLNDPLTTANVAQFIACVKLSRMQHSPTLDNWIDLAGYAACGAECEAIEAGLTDKWCYEGTDDTRPSTTIPHEVGFRFEVATEDNDDNDLIEGAVLVTWKTGPFEGHWWKIPKTEPVVVATIDMDGKRITSEREAAMDAALANDRLVPMPVDDVGAEATQPREWLATVDSPRSYKLQKYEQALQKSEEDVIFLTETVKATENALKSCVDERNRLAVKEAGARKTIHDLRQKLKRTAGEEMLQSKVDTLTVANKEHRHTLAEAMEGHARIVQQHKDAVTEQAREVVKLKGRLTAAYNSREAVAADLITARAAHQRLVADRDHDRKSISEQTRCIQFKDAQIKDLDAEKSHATKRVNELVFEVQELGQAVAVERRDHQASIEQYQKSSDDLNTANDLIGVLRGEVAKGRAESAQWKKTAVDHSKDVVDLRESFTEARNNVDRLNVKVSVGQTELCQAKNLIRVLRADVNKSVTNLSSNPLPTEDGNCLHCKKRLCANPGQIYKDRNGNLFCHESCGSCYALHAAAALVATAPKILPIL